MGAAKRFTQNPGSNAICYYRYSSGAQRDVSIDQQREAAKEYAKAHGYHIIKEYEDHAISQLISTYRTTKYKLFQGTFNTNP